MPQGSRNCSVCRSPLDNRGACRNAKCIENPEVRRRAVGNKDKETVSPPARTAAHMPPPTPRSIPRPGGFSQVRSASGAYRNLLGTDRTLPREEYMSPGGGKEEQPPTRRDRPTPPPLPVEARIPRHAIPAPAFRPEDTIPAKAPTFSAPPQGVIISEPPKEDQEDRPTPTESPAARRSSKPTQVDTSQQFESRPAPKVSGTHVRPDRFFTEPTDRNGSEDE